MVLKPNQIRTLIGLCVGVGMFLLLAWGAYLVHKNGLLAAYALTMVIALFGVSLGWLVGLLASPYDDGELKRFAKYAGVLSVFLTGYLAAKLDPVIKRVLDRDPIDLDSITVLRLSLFLTCLVIGTIASYAYRSYLFGPNPKH